MKTSRAHVVELSRYTKAVITFTRSGRLGPITLIRGADAITLGDIEARNLSAALLRRELEPPACEGD